MEVQVVEQEGLLHQIQAVLETHQTLLRRREIMVELALLVAEQGEVVAAVGVEFGVPMIRAEEKLRAVPAGPDEAGVLAVPQGTPLLQVERLSFSYGDLPVELRRGLYCTARHHYRNELN